MVGIFAHVPKIIQSLPSEKHLEKRYCINFDSEFDSVIDFTPDFGIHYEVILQVWK